MLAILHLPLFIEKIRSFFLYGISVNVLCDRSRSVVLLRYEIRWVLVQQDLSRFLAKMAFIGIVGLEHIAEGFCFSRQT